jgi:hypothetical protein
MIRDITFGDGKEQKTEMIEGYREIETVWCKPMGKRVELEFCMTGGPMRATNEVGKPVNCEYFRRLEEQNKRIILVHVLPIEEMELVRGTFVKTED